MPLDVRSDDIRVDRDLARTIGHVIKYSLRPRVCNPCPSAPHYVVGDVLSLAFPRRPVLYSTFMSRTGWGMRELSDGELASCFELPDYVIWHDRFLRDLVPLQLCRSVIDAVTASSTLQAPRAIRQRLDCTATSETSSASDAVWISSLGKWLPGHWADAEISDKAVKSDNAPVDFRPWHRRIQLVLPCSIGSLSIFERFFMRKWRFTVIRSLFQFMSVIHGPNWFVPTDREKGKRRSEELSSTSSKLLCVANEGSRGGVFSE